MLEDVLSSRLNSYFKMHWIKSRYLFAISVIRHLTRSRFEVQSPCWVALQPALQHSRWKKRHLSPSGKDQTEKASNFIYDVYSFSPVLSNHKPQEMLFYYTQRRYMSLDPLCSSCKTSKQKTRGILVNSIQQWQVFSNPSMLHVVLQGIAGRLLTVNSYWKGRNSS